MKYILKISLFMILSAIIFIACEKPQELHPAPYPEEGFYITGKSIYIDTMTMNAKLDKGITLNAQDEKQYRDSLYVKFLFVSSVDNGFAVKEQVGAETITWGLEGSWAETKAGVYSGNVTKEGVNFTAPEDGYYFFAIDLITAKAYLFKLTDWYIVGDAVVGTPNTMTLTTANKDSAQWKGSGITLKTGKFHYRFYSDDKFAIDGDSVFLVTYIGDATSAPVIGGSDIEIIADQDTFTFCLKHNILTGFSGSTTLPPYDPRTHTYSLIGSAFYTDNDPNNPATAWNVDFDLTFDATSSDTTAGIYKFVYNNMYFIGGGEFKLRVDHDWNGQEMGYNDVDEITGDVSNISNAGGQYGNFKVANDAIYNVTFTYDVTQNKKSVDFTVASK